MVARSNAAPIAVGTDVIQVNAVSDAAATIASAFVTTSSLFFTLPGQLLY
jgi:hypothetical protein